jgi:hypothetical protein
MTFGKLVVFSENSNKTDRHGMAEILLKVALNTINLNLIHTEQGSDMSKNGNIN